MTMNGYYEEPEGNLWKGVAVALFIMFIFFIVILSI